MGDDADDAENISLERVDELGKRVAFLGLGPSLVGRPLLLEALERNPVLAKDGD